MKPALVLIVLMLTAACQRTVRTESRFIPPQSPDQQACVERCYQTDRDCLGSPTAEPAPLRAPAQSQPSTEEAAQARREYEECSKRVQAEFESCSAGARTSNRRGSCYRPVCVVQPGSLPVSEDAAPAVTVNDAGACGRIFRACFERCGGKVETREVCEGAC